MRWITIPRGPNFLFYDPANSNRAMIERFSIMVCFIESELNVAMLVMGWACAAR